MTKDFILTKIKDNSYKISYKDEDENGEIVIRYAFVSLKDIKQLFNSKHIFTEKIYPTQKHM